MVGHQARDCTRSGVAIMPGNCAHDLHDIASHMATKRHRRLLAVPRSLMNIRGPECLTKALIQTPEPLPGYAKLDGAVAPPSILFIGFSSMMLVVALLLALHTLSFGAAGNPLSPAAQASSVREAYLSGEKALQAGDLTGAEKAFREVLARQPQDPGANANLGVVYMRRQQWGFALRYLKAAERLAPSLGGIRLNIGLVYYRQAQYSSAIAPLAAAVHKEPKLLQARYLLGLCYFFTGDYVRTVATLDPVWAQETYNLNYLYVLGIAAHNAKRPEVEQRALGRLVEIGGNTPEFHLIMGKAHLNRQEDDEAIQELNQAAQGDPKLPFVHYNLGMAYMHKQQYDNARDEFLKDIAVEPDVALNYDQLGQAYESLGQDEPAEQNFQKAVKLDPKLASSYMGLAKIYQKQEKYPQALQALNAAQKLAPKAARIHYLKGQVFRRMGKLQQAKLELDTATRLMNAMRNKREQQLSGEGTADPQLAKEPPQ